MLQHALTAAHPENQKYCKGSNFTEGTSVGIRALSRCCIWLSDTCEGNRNTASVSWHRASNALIPTGTHGGEHVEVEGSFDNWTTRQTMQRSGKDFTIVKLLPPGVYQVRPLHALLLPGTP